MTQKEANKRFNALPKEHRVTIIANDCDREIRWLKREKQSLIVSHKIHLARINERIKIVEHQLIELL